MSIEQIKTPKQGKYLKDVNFNGDASHLALTKYGAANMIDEPYLLKSLHIENDVQLNKSDEAIIVADDNTGVNLEKQKEIDMSIEKDQRIVELEKKLKQVELSKAYAKYNLPEELSAGLVEALSGLESDEAVIKALDHMVVASEQAIEEAAKPVAQEENELVKKLSKEAGVSGEAEVTIEKSIKDSVIEILQGAK